MTADLKKVLRDPLDNLTEKEFKRFRHFLSDRKTIAWGKLEKADTDDTVDLMVQVYSTRAGDVMLSILKDMNHNQLAIDLKRALEKCQHLLQDAHETQCKVTKTGGVPSPGQIQFPSVQPHSVTLRWSPPEGAPGPPGPYRYRVTWRRAQETETQKIHRITVAVPEVELTGLLPGEKYCFTLVALSEDGRLSPYLRGRVHTGIPVPERLTVSSITASSANLSWLVSPEMEQTPHSFLVSYQSEGTEPKSISTESCSTDITGLEPGTEYTVKVYTELQHGGKSQPASDKFKTGAGAVSGEEAEGGAEE